MKIARDILILALAVTFATITLVALPMPPQTSYYGSMPPNLSQGPIENLSDKSLIAVGLVSKKSVMDGPSTDLNPTQPPPTVPEHTQPPTPKMPKVMDHPQSDVKPTEPKSTDMSGVPPSQPGPPPQMPTPAGPQPGPQPSNTDSTTMSAVSTTATPTPPPSTSGMASSVSSVTTSVTAKLPDKM